MIAHIASAIAAAALLAPLPTNKFPTSPTKALPTKPLPKVNTSDKVSSIPEPASTSQILYVAPHSFNFSGDLFLIGNEWIKMNRTAKAVSNGVDWAAWATIELPVGAKIKALDCQVRVETVDASKGDKNVDVGFALFRTPYRTAVRQNIRPLTIRAYDGPGLYWNRAELPATAEFATVSKHYYYTLDVRMARSEREDFKFQGCRIEYTTP